MNSVSNNTADKIDARQEYESTVARDFFHNAVRLVSFDFVWGLGMPFVMLNTVILVYMAELKAPKILIGIIASIFTILCPLQILTSYYFRNRPRKIWLICSYLGITIPWILYSILFFYYQGPVSNKIQLAFFCFFRPFVFGNSS